MAYTNPIPSLDDETQSLSASIKFHFNEPVTKSEAAEAIQKWFAENTLDEKQIVLSGTSGIRYAEIQDTLGPYDSDPKGLGPRPEYERKERSSS